jgi:tetratricopeptide (TPR) repeat protein
VAGPDEGWHDARARQAEQSGNAFAALWHLDRLVALRPSDWLPYARRARVLGGGDEWSRAAADYAAAKARGAGEALPAWYAQRAAACAAGGRWSEALWYQGRLLACRPGDGELLAERAWMHGRLGQRAEADADLARAVESGVDPAVLVRLADDEGRRGGWAQAAALFAAAGARGRLDPVVCYRHGLACLKTGDRAGYQRLCARLVKELPGVGPGLKPDVANLAAMLCAVGPDSVTDWQTPLAWMEHALRVLAGIKVSPAQEKQAQAVRHAWLNTQGAVLYRAGRYREAIDRLREAAGAPGQEATFHDCVFLAMAHFRLGHAAEARSWLTRGLRQRLNVGRGPSWEALEVELLVAEAEALLGADTGK